MLIGENQSDVTSSSWYMSSLQSNLQSGEVTSEGWENAAKSDLSYPLFLVYGDHSLAGHHQDTTSLTEEELI